MFRIFFFVVHINRYANYRTENSLNSLNSDDDDDDGDCLFASLPCIESGCIAAGAGAGLFKVEDATIDDNDDDDDDNGQCASEEYREGWLPLLMV